MTRKCNFHSLNATNKILISFSLFQLGGIAFIVIGGIIISKAEDFKSALKDYDTYSLPITLIVIGVVIFIIAFFGCCGAVRESECMTMTYAFLLFLLLVVQIVIAVLVFLYKDDFEKAVQNSVREVFERPNENREAIDTIQRTVSIDTWSCLSLKLNLLVIILVGMLRS